MRNSGMLLIQSGHTFRTKSHFLRRRMSLVLVRVVESGTTSGMNDIYTFLN